jgi:hypothetical protein
MIGIMTDLEQADSSASSGYGMNRKNALIFTEELKGYSMTKRVFSGSLLGQHVRTILPIITSPAYSRVSL